MADDSSVEQASREALERTMRLLAESVPLTLLIDLAAPVHSREIYRAEPGETGWLVGVAS